MVCETNRLKVKTKRDLTIDLFKGFTILWIIHIHTVFWSGEFYISNTVRQFTLLIDVPIFFFLSGYLLFVGPSETLRRRIVRQFVRLYLMYIVFCLVALAGVYLLRLSQDGSVPGLAAKLTDIVLVRIDFMDEGQGFVLNLWFLKTYFMVLGLAFVLSLWPESWWRNLLLATLAFSAYLLLRPGLKRTDETLYTYTVFTFFYSTLFFLGAWFRKVEKRVKPLYIILFLAALAVSVFIVFRNDSHTLIMQRHKFPPNHQYMIYSLPYVSLFVLVKRMWPLENVNQNLVTKFIEWCSFVIVGDPDILGADQSIRNVSVAIRTVHVAQHTFHHRSGYNGSCVRTVTSLDSGNETRLTVLPQ